jgi:hypothetical protein
MQPLRSDGAGFKAEEVTFPVQDAFSGIMREIFGNSLLLYIDII